MKSETPEDCVMDYIGAHKGVTASDIFIGINKKSGSSSRSLNTIRSLLRKLHKEKKVIRTGVHTFKYKLRK